MNSAVQDKHFLSVNFDMLVQQKWMVRIDYIFVNV